MKNYQEAIVDSPNQSLSDIFDPEGKLKPEVVNTINKGVQEIKNQFPNLPIDDYFVVGAAVTYQYSPKSDIDTTISVPRATDDVFKQANDWIGSNLDPKYKFGARPYQFKVSKGTRGQLQSFDSVYDIQSQIKTGKPAWIKKPDPNKTNMDFKKFISNEESKEHNLYKSIEKTIKPSIESLFKLIKASGGVLNDQIKQQTLTVLDRYKIIKKLRSKSYEGSEDLRDQGKISKNWGVGNIIYKFLDREGYIDLFGTLKELVKNQFQNFTSIVGKLTSILQNVVSSSIGFAVGRMKPPQPRPQQPQQPRPQQSPQLQTASVFHNSPMLAEDRSIKKKVLIIDVESTCDTSPITNEIIEIGLSDTSGAKFPPLFIKPNKSEVTKFCTKLTSITPEQIDELGLNPQEAYGKLNKIFSMYDKWASYGDYDKEMLLKMESLYGLTINMPEHENVRLLFARKVLNSNSPQAAPKNPKDALEMLGMSFKGFNHRGADDAMNIANLYNVLQDYKETKNESFFSKNPMADKESAIYKLVDEYRSMLLNSSKEGGDTDDNIHHDIIKKNDDHKNITRSIAKLFSLIHDSEKDSDKLKPSFFSDTVFEKIARYAKRKLGYHADDIAAQLRKINPASIEDLYKIWQPGSWFRS